LTYRPALEAAAQPRGRPFDKTMDREGDKQGQGERDRAGQDGRHGDVRRYAVEDHLVDQIERVRQHTEKTHEGQVQEPERSPGAPADRHYEDRIERHSLKAVAESFAELRIAVREREQK